MGLGKYKNGRHQPITPYLGSWAQEEQERQRAAQSRQPVSAVSTKHRHLSSGNLDAKHPGKD